MTGCAILRLEFPPSAAEEDAFLLRIDAAQPQEIAERRCAAEACFAEKSTSLKARRARDFKSKGVLLHTFALVYLILLYTTQQQAKTKKKKKQQKKQQKKKQKKKKQKKNHQQQKKQKQKKKEEDGTKTRSVFFNTQIVEILRHYTQ